MRWVVGGASGFIGSALVRALRGAGDDVVCLVRRGPDESAWDDLARALDSADVVVTLGGVGIGDRRWTAARRELIRSSRVSSTSLMAAALARQPSPPPVWLSASAIGYYGDTGDAIVDESSPRGTGFLASVVEQWEAATVPAVSAGVRVVCCRSGIVLSPAGSTLGRMLPLFRLGLGGRLGSGTQWMSWIALADEIAALRFLATSSGLAGPVNLVAPTPVRNGDFTRALASVLHRPAALPVPPLALRAAFGGFADEGVLASSRVVPSRLEEAGFSFAFEDVDAALRAMIG